MPIKWLYACARKAQLLKSLVHQGAVEVLDGLVHAEVVEELPALLVRESPEAVDQLHDLEVAAVGKGRAGGVRQGFYLRLLPVQFLIPRFTQSGASGPALQIVPVQGIARLLRSSPGCIHHILPGCLYCTIVTK